MNLMPARAVCLDCDSAQPVTTLGTCGTCGSTSVLRLSVRPWPWLRRRPTHLLRRVRNAA